LRRGRWRIGVVNHLSAFFAVGFTFASSYR
jgi:hypothetical protein